MAALTEEKVLTVHHWTDRLFSFTTTRSPAFRFRNGEFTMIGVPDERGRPIMRAYSMTTPNHADELGFFSIKVPGGPLTSRLQRIEPGDRVLINNKPGGSLVLDYLLPGKRLYLLATGTGLAPFLSIVQAPEVYERFDTIVLVHGVRRVADLAYRQMLTRDLPNAPYIGALAERQLIYYPTVTREKFIHQGRIPDLLRIAKLTGDTGMPLIDRRHDRFMLCGNPAMLLATRRLLESVGFVQGDTGVPGEYLIETAYMEK